MGWSVCFSCFDGSLSRRHWLGGVFVCVLMAQCHDAMCKSVFNFVLIALTPWVGLCVCLCSVDSLSRRHGLVFAFVCVLTALCHDVMGWSVCLFCVLMAHCHDAMDCSVCLFVSGWWPIVMMQWVGLCVCLCSGDSLARCRGVGLCVLMAHCHEAIHWSECLCSDGSLSRRHGLVYVFICVVMAHCQDAMG